jgi:hypothetical protein
MPNATAETLDGPVSGTLQQFNRYGLPGLVIGAQFLIIVGLLWFGLGAIKEATIAMAQMTGAVHELTQTIRDMKK